MNAVREDVPRLIETAKATGSRLIYVSNPNSPMGTWWSASEIKDFIGALPPETMLVLDEAYCDTAPVPTAPLVDVSNPQVIRYRTFSKAYGLAGARIGYAIGERSVIEAFDKVRNHYGINRVGQLGALAALLDQEYLAHAVAEIAAARQRIAAIAVENGLSPLASAANFVAIHCGEDGAFAARVLQALLMRDVFVRKPIASGLDPFIRVSCGRNDDLDVFAEALTGGARRCAADIMMSEVVIPIFFGLKTAASRRDRERDDIHPAPTRPQSRRRHRRLVRCRPVVWCRFSR